jgi:Lon protease-like protein
MQPLHVFEARYRELLREALAGDRLITMATLAPGWEKDYEGRPPIHPVGCLGKIAAHHQLDDGASNILLYGLCRVQMVRELPPEKPFREAEVRVIQDVCTPEDVACGPILRRRLRETFLKLLPHLPQAQEQLDQVLGSDLPLGALSDIISYVVDLTLADKETLLAEPNAHRRAERLLAHLSGKVPQESAALSADFLPGFSAN